MRSFKDRQGRTHQVEINVATLGVVRAATGVDLWRAFDDGAKVWQELYSNPIVLTNVVYLLTGGVAGDQASEKAFAAGIDGDTLERMERSFREELTEFYPPQKRPLIRRIMEKGAELSQLLEAQAQGEIDRLTPESVLQRMRAGSGSAGASPASAVSTPGPSPSVS